jgi:putative endonuclease
MSFHVYILYSESCDKYYIGQTMNIDQRMAEHNAGRGGSFSSKCSSWKLMHSETFPTRTEAVRREREIKNKKSRRYIEWIIAG